MPSTLGPIAGTPYISAVKPGVLFVQSDGLQGVDANFAWDATTGLSALGNAIFGSNTNVLAADAPRARTPYRAVLYGHYNKGFAQQNFASGTGNYVDGHISMAMGNVNICTANDSVAMGNRSTTGRRMYPVSAHGVSDPGLGTGNKAYVSVADSEGDITGHFPNALRAGTALNGGTPAQQWLYDKYGEDGVTCDASGNVLPPTMSMPGDLTWALHPYMIVRSPDEEIYITQVKILKAEYTGGVGTTIWYDSPTEVYANFSYVYGSSAPTVNVNGHSAGNGTFAAGLFANAFGYGSVALGYECRAWGTTSFATGTRTRATAQHSSAHGYQTTAAGFCSTAIGSGIKVSGAYSVGIALANDANEITAANTMAILGGAVVVNAVAPRAGYTFDVVGQMGATNSAGHAIIGTSVSDRGVYGYTTSGTGVHGEGASGTGVYGRSTSGRAGYFYVNSNTSTQPTVEILQDHTGNTQTVLKVRGDGTGDLLNILDDTSEVFTILDGGNVGILKDTPAHMLHIGSGGMCIQRSDAPYIIFTAGTTNVAQLRGVAGTTDTIAITDAGGGNARLKIVASTGVTTINAASGDPLTVQANGNPALVIDSSKNTTLSGSLKQSGATSGTLTHSVPAAVTSYTLTWPAAVGSATFLKCAADGTLSWESPAGGAHDAVTLNANIGDNILQLSTQEIQAKDAGLDALVFWNNTSNKLEYKAASTYLTAETSHADVVVDGDFSSQGIMLRGASSGTYSILTDNSANWNTAYGWGNHASAGYAASGHNHDLSYSALGHGHSYLANLVEDATPQLGGTLDCQGYTIYGNSTASGTLLLESTSHGTKGKISSVSPHEFASGAYHDGIVTDTLAANAVTIDFTTGNDHYLDYSAQANAAVITLVAPGGPCSVRILVKCGGAGAVTWTPPGGDTVIWSGGMAPVLSTSGVWKIVGFWYDGTYWRGGVSDTFTIPT